MRTSGAPVVLGLGTYPIRRPVHGGQRRVAALAAFYRSIGVEYRYACVYQASAYGGDAVGPHDVAHCPTDETLRGIPHVSDLDSGVFASRDPDALAAFRRLAADLRPSAVQIEQPFLWPLARRLLESPALRDVPVIYSSHNVEGPLKEKILRDSGVGGETARAVRRRIDALEAEATAAAALVVAVSAEEAQVYRALSPGAAVVVARNGVDRPPPSDEAGRRPEFDDGRPFLLFVGSAYPPNIAGFAHYVLRSGLFFAPPVKSLAICGGVSDGIFAHPWYYDHLKSYSERVHFFSKIDDIGLFWLKKRARAILLPIREGGGSNLKTAEALTSGAAVIATTMAMRSFDEFGSAPGVTLADTPESFFEAMVAAYHAPRPALDPAERTRRESLYWDRAFAASGLADRLRALLGV